MKGLDLRGRFAGAWESRGRPRAGRGRDGLDLRSLSLKDWGLGALSQKGLSLRGWGQPGSAILLALLTTGCAQPFQGSCGPDISGGMGVSSACTSRSGTYPGIPPGASQAEVEILSSPTSATIYLDGQSIGRTPLTHPLWYSSRTRYLTLTAEPLYPGQARQEQQLRVPPLPRRVQFFMNNPPKDAEKAEAGTAH